MNDGPCKRCGGASIRIGISGGSPLVCKRDCAGKCPTCLSPDIEPFVTWSYMGFAGSTTEGTMHCIKHGHVWTETTT